MQNDFPGFVAIKKQKSPMIEKTESKIDKISLIDD